MKKRFLILSVLTAAIYNHNLHANDLGGQAGIERRAVGGVSQIVAGDRVTITPASGRGRVTVTADVQGGGGGVFAPTMTFTMSMGGLMYLSTQAFGIPNASWSPAFSTWTIRDLCATCAIGSSVGVVGIDVVYSSGSQIPQVTKSKIFPRLDVSTTAATGVSAISQFLSSTTIMNAFSWLHVEISTLPASGNMPQDCKVVIHAIEKNAYFP